MWIVTLSESYCGLEENKILAETIKDLQDILDFLASNSGQRITLSRIENVNFISVEEFKSSRLKQ